MKLLNTSQPRALTPTVLLGLIISATFVLTASADLTNCAPPPAGLVSWWKGEGNALDQVGTNNGTLGGNATYGPGVVGQGFVFDGSGDTVAVGNLASLQMQDFTIETWIKRASSSITSYGSGGNGIIFGYGYGGYGLYLGPTGQPVLTKVGINDVRPSTTVTGTNCHHLAVSKSGSTVVFYVDGVAYAASAYNPGFVFSTGAAIGARGDTSDNSFLGTIDEVAVYNRALGASEIQAIYLAGAAGKCMSPGCTPPASGMVSWWRGESNGGDSAGANNGVLIGGATYTSGVVGQALSFDGTGYVEVPDSPSLRLTNALTIEFWAKHKQLDRPYSDVIIEKGGDWTGGTLNYGVNLAPSQFNYRFTFWCAGVNRGSIGIADTNWHHCAVVARQGDVDPTFYLDGVQQPVTYRDGGPTLNLYPSTKPLHIGAQVDPITGWYYYSKTIVDELSIFSRALTAAEIQAIYAAGSSGKCTTPTPPFILTQPAGQTVTVGANASFTVTAGGTPPLSYQWQFNGTNIGGATGSVLTLTNIQAAQAGNYAARVTSSYGSTISSNALLTVIPTSLCATPPAGLVSWWRAESDSLDAVGGNNGTPHNGVGFTTGEVGQALSFDGTNGYVEVPDSPSLRLTNTLTIEFWVKRKQLDRPYSDVVIEKGGDWTGGTLNYWVGLNPPQYNYLLTFECAGVNRGSTGIADTNWHHCAVVARQGDVDPTFYIDGVQQPVTYRSGGSTLNLYPSTKPLHIGAQVDPITGWYYYSKTIVDEMSIYSRALTAAEIQAIYAAGSLGKCTTPVLPFILTQPASQTLTNGVNASFTVVAGGATPLSYQWQFNGTNIGGATGSVLTLTNVQVAQAGNYAARVTNSYGSTISSNALLAVIPTSSCVPAPAGLVSWWRAESDPLDAVGGNNGTLYNGVSFTNGEVGQAFSFDGTNDYVEVPDSPSLRLTNALTIECWVKRKQLDRPYSDVIIEKGGDWTGGTLNYWVGLGPPQYNYLFSFECRGVNRGSISIADTNWHHCAVVARQGDVDPTFYLDGVQQPVTYRSGGSTLNLYPSTKPLHIGAQVDPITGWYHYSKTIVDELSLYNRALTAGEIQAIYTAGSFGKCTTPILPFILTQPASQTLTNPVSASLTVAAAGTPPLSYQWQHFSTNLSGATNVLLALSNIKTSDAGDYRVVITNPAGSITSAVATLTIVQPPVITRQPGNVVAMQGATVSFSVIANGRAPLAYQWQKNGAPLAGQTNASLTISNAQPADFASYAVGITNTDGGVLSAVAKLTLPASPVIYSHGFNSDTFMLTVPTEVGPTYLVEYKDSLDDPSWKVLTTLNGTGLPIPITDNGLTNRARFYRVRVR